MGGETSAIQHVANKITQDIFRVFKWQRAESQDMNWKCELQGHDKKTHPSDVVFHYIDPYEEEVVYLNTDLKSYASGSIGKGIVEGAISSLALATECANISSQWRNRYIKDESLGFNVRGLLFLYNHDHLYDKDFYESVMKKVDSEAIKCSPNVKLHILDPYKISDIINIAFDIKNLMGSGGLPQPNQFQYYYPDLALTRIKHPVNEKTAATVEILSSPYVIIKHNPYIWDEEEHDGGFVIYYNQPGNSIDEFVYFFDMLSNYQILTDAKKISIRHCHINPHEEAVHHFKKAKQKYSSHWLVGENERLFTKVSFDKVATVVINYSLEAIGMEQR